MPWRCSECGLDNDDSVKRCAGCSFTKFGALQLVSQATGRKMRIQVDATMGRSVLKSLGDEDVKYASEPQFRITKDATLCAWAIVPDPVAKNPTFLNGTQIATSPTALPNGAILSIGAEKLKMTVELEN